MGKQQREKITRRVRKLGHTIAFKLTDAPQGDTYEIRTRCDSCGHPVKVVVVNTAKKLEAAT